VVLAALLRPRQRIKFVQLADQREVPVHPTLHGLVERDAGGAEHPRSDRRRDVLRFDAIVK
jgi:hypothetical protein